MHTNENRRTYRQYTILFLLFSALILLPFLLTNNTIIWRVDGAKQHYPFMLYIARWIRESVLGIFNGQGIQLFDFTMGLGTDIISSLNYYGFGDPMMLIPALCPQAAIPFIYSFLMFFRLYLAGIALIYMLRYFHIENKAAPLGALGYTVCSFLFCNGLLRHAIFLNPGFQLPLMIVGIDRILRGKSPYLFIAVTTWTALCGYYILYMCSIMIFVFALVRYFAIKREQNINSLPATMLKSIGYYLIAILLAAPVFVPACLGFLNCIRDDLSEAFNLLKGMSLNYYLLLPQTFVLQNNWGNAMPLMLLFGCCLTLLKRDHWRKQRLIFFGICLLIVLVPSLSGILNGFAYTTNRWTFAFALVIAAFGVQGLPSIKALTKEQRNFSLCFFAAFCAYSLGCLFFKVTGLKSFDTDRTVYIAYTFCVSLGVGFTIFAVNTEYWRSKQRPKLTTAILTGVFLLNALFNCWIPTYFGLNTMEYVTNAQIVNYAADSPLNNDVFADAKASVRTDLSYGMLHRTNDGTLLRISTTGLYNSVIPGVLMQSLSDLDLNNHSHACYVAGLDCRAVLEALWGAEYYCASLNSTEAVPYGYTLEKETDRCLIYHSDHTLPIGFTTDKVIPQEVYNSLSGIDKQWALLQGAVTDLKGYTVVTPRLTSQKIDYEIVQADNVTLSDGVMSAKENGTLTLSFHGLPNSETYLSFIGLNLASVPGTTAEIECRTENALNVARICRKDKHQGLPQDNVSVNLGYNTEPCTTVTLTFKNNLETPLTALEIICQPMDDFVANVAELRHDVLENIEYGNNRVSGTISVSVDKLLILSIPHSTGWSAWVDGVKTPIHIVDGCMMGVELSTGTHTIELHYTTPGLMIGLILFFVGLSALTGVILYWRKKAHS